MYINPFLAGVLATIFTEIGVLFVWSLITLFNRGNHND